MKRAALFAATGAAAICAAAAPALAGLVGNTSFSHQIPVRVPSGASPVRIDDPPVGRVSVQPAARTSHAPARSSAGTDRPAGTSASPAARTSAAPAPSSSGDDHRRRGRTAVTGTSAPAPARTTASAHEPEPSDSPSTPVASTSDDHGGGRGSGGGGDNGGHGGRGGTDDRSTSASTHGSA